MSTPASEQPVTGAAAAAAAAAAPRHQLDNETRFQLIRSVGEECISETELRNLVEKKPTIIAYDGFEPSGRMHIAQGLQKAANVNKCTAAGVDFVFWVADWFGYLNDKMGGDLTAIQTVGKYLIQVWQASGMKMAGEKGAGKVTFLWASDEITRQAPEYWSRVLDIGRRSTVNRIKKCCTIMGRADNSLTAAQILYPLMQCADIFFLKADICQLGVDQRKVNMLAREYCDQTGRKLKPVILSHHMLAGLAQGQAKMSKSNPDSAIFMEDAASDVARKINKAFCPAVALPDPGAVTATAGAGAGAGGAAAAADGDDDAPGATNNAELSAEDKARLEYLRNIHFAAPDASVFAIEGVEGSPFSSFGAVEAAFQSGALTKQQLKTALINPCLEYIRYIIFSNAGATFAVDGVAGSPFTTYRAAEAAFLSGAMSEQQLKGALIAALNVLLEPVRQHFATGDAKALLDEVKELRRPKTADEERELQAKLEERKQAASAAAAAAAASEKHGVAWMPCALRVPLGTLMSLVQGMNRFISDSSNAKCTLVLPDWSCFSNGMLRGELKDIAAALEYHAEIVKALGLSPSVRIVKQSEMINAEPNKYWLSAINAGRKFKLVDIETALGADSVENAGQVVGALMHAADADVLGATALFTTQQLQGHNQIAAAHAPAVRGVTFATLASTLPELLCDPTTKPTGADDWLYADDNEMDTKRKIKKAFCAPANPATPMLDIAAFLCQQGDGSKFVIERSADNGGNKEYTAPEALVGDFAASQLHPGDLKAAVSKAVLQIVATVQSCVTSAEQKKRALVLRNAEKKLAKN